MFRFPLALILLTLAVPARAQDLPALYDVTGVVAGDVLNVRAEPSGSAAIIGAFARDTTGVEVVGYSETGTWALVNFEERAGWASLAYLAAQPMGGFLQVPRFSCFGTEPFWSIEAGQNQLSQYRNADGTEATFLASQIMPAANMTGYSGMWLGGAPDAAALTFRNEICNDGMSDRSYGISVQVVLGGRLQGALAGCCSLEPR